MRRTPDRQASAERLRWLGLIGGLSLILGVHSTAFAGGPDPSTIAIDPPTPLKMGDNPSGTIVAHLTQVGGQPVSAARLELFIDGTSASSNLTNGDGAAQLNFHRDLLPGDHEIEVRFNGSRVAAASNAFSQLTVLPVDDSRLSIEALPTLQLGQDPTVNLVAHLVSNKGNPVSGARLDLLVDGVVTGGGITDPSGTAQITFRRVLTVGDHRVDLKFAGSRVAAPTSTSATLSVLPVDGSRLTLGPLPTLQVGQDPTVNLVAHLVSAGGEPIGGARLDALVDGAPAGSGVTDAQGTAQLTFRRELAAGQHQVDLKFDGSRVAAPASTSARLSVLPIAVHGLTVEPLSGLQVGQDPTVAVTAHLASDTGAPVPGARLAVLVDGSPATTGMTDADGTAAMTFRRELAEGEHPVEVRFAGSRAAAPASTSTSLSVAPIAVHGLRIEPLPALQVGQDRGGTAVAHLVADSGDPVPGARLTLLIDGTPAGSGVTDATGKAELIFRRDLVAGEHPVEVRFAGSRAAAPASAAGMLSVAPVAEHGLALDPLPTLQVGLDPAATVVAHMSTDAGEPVPGVRLDLLIDGVPAAAGLTDATGSVPLRFRRDLLPGEHPVEVRFAGSRAAAPASTSGTLSVLPALNSSLSIDPLPMVRVGVDAVVTVIAHLTQDSGEPVAGARLALLVDGTQQRLGTTDATGAAKLQFHPDLLPGDHQVEVQFGGTRGLSPASLTQTLTVLPHQLEVQVMPPIAGARIAVNGQVFTSDDQGLAHLQMDKPGAYHLEVLPFENLEPGKKLEFNRWGDEVFTAGRDVVVPQTTRLAVGFNTSYLVSLNYLDPEERPVDMKRVTSATLTSSVGASQTFRPGEQQWVQATRAVRRPGGLGEAQLEYSVDDVQLEGANVVNAREQRFYPVANLDFPVHLLLHTMRITARVAFAGAPIGSGVWLTHPDGHTDWRPFAQDAALDLRLLPRGQYMAQVVAPGVTFAQPVALSRDQEVELKVVTYDELKSTGAALAALALGLLVVGRRSLLRWPLRTRGRLLAAGPGGWRRRGHVPRLEETQ